MAKTFDIFAEFDIFLPLCENCEEQLIFQKSPLIYSEEDYVIMGFKCSRCGNEFNVKIKNY
jgi:hypothetical protein